MIQHNMNAIANAYRLYCRVRFPLPTEQQIIALESRCGSEFPVAFREFILHFNGGCFTNPVITSAYEPCPADGLVFMSGIGATHESAELASASDLALFDDNVPLEGNRSQPGERFYAAKRLGVAGWGRRDGAGWPANFASIASIRY